ncbi:MAG: hypothetical protein SynsKO_04000 [Synoicihabitans sp.]
MTFRKILSTALIVVAVTASAFAESASLSVFSHATREYQSALKERDPDEPIYYAISFAKATQLTSDEQVDNADFAERLSESLVQELSLRGFELAPDSESAEQLLVIHAGTTHVPGFRSSSLNEYNTFMTDEESALWSHNAAVLGYTESYRNINALVGMSFSQTLRQDLTSDLRLPRNFVIVTAYDFDRVQSGEGDEEAVLWRTHISVKDSSTPFAEQVATLVSTGSGFFGKQSRGLVRRFRSEVTVGPATVVEEDVPAP